MENIAIWSRMMARSYVIPYFIPYFRVSIVLPCISRLQLQTVASLTGRHKLLVDVKRKDSERQTDKESEERWGAHVIPTRRQCSTWSIAPTYRVENVIQEQYCGGVPTSTSQFPPLGGAHRTPALRRSRPSQKNSVQLRSVEMKSLWKITGKTYASHRLLNKPRKPER